MDESGNRTRKLKADYRQPSYRRRNTKTTKNDVDKNNDYDFFEAGKVPGLMMRLNNLLKRNGSRWLGHVDLMEENKQTKIMYIQEMKETKPLGGPKQR